jgi:GumC protein
MGALSGAFGGVLGLPTTAGISQEMVTVVLESRAVRGQIVDRYKLRRHYASRDRQAAASRLGRNSTIRLTRRGSIEIEVSDSDPQVAAGIANSYVALLKDFVARNVRLFLQRRKAEYLEGALEDSKAALEDAEQALADYAGAHKIVSMEAEAETLVQNLGEVEKQLRIAEAESQYASTMLSATRAALQRIAASPPDALPAHSPLLQNLRLNLVELNYQLAMARRDRTEADPQVRSLLAAIEDTLSQARQELTRIATSADQGTAPEVINLAAVDLGQRAKTEALTRARDELMGMMQGVPETALVYSRLKREVEVQQRIYATLRSEYESAKVGQDLEEEPFVVLDRAEPPSIHSQPRMRVNVAIAFVLSAVIGILAALVVAGRSTRPGAKR